jgi:peptide/nickel transport system substrate-binding protein
MWLTYNTLMTYPHKNARQGGGRLVPGLAAAPPKVSRNGRTYTFVLRKGLRYSNGKPVRASDFNYSIERLYRANSQGVGFYTNIVGAKRYQDTQRGNISGIVTNNAKRTVVFKLTQPRGDFMSILALLFASPVPGGTSADDQSTRSLPSTGQYHITNYTPGQGFTLARNKYFKPTKYTPRAYANSIRVSIVPDSAAATQRVIGGGADFSGQGQVIPPDRLSDISRRFPKRLKLYASANTYYFWMNTRSAVFRKLNVRKAVNMALNRSAMIRTIYGGLGKATQQVLPPNYPQYRKLSLYKYNRTRARTLVRQAGVDGAHITVWGRDNTESRQATELLNAALESIGFRTTLKILPVSTYYTTIGNANTKDLDIGWARWLEDYPHPSDWFDVLLNGKRITSQNNNNYSNANVSKINNLIERLNRVPLSAKVNKQWAQVDKMVMQQALWAPWVNKVFTDFFGARVNMASYYDQPIYHTDFSRLYLK